MIHYFVKLNEGVVVNATYITRIKRLTAANLEELNSYAMSLLDAALKGTGKSTDGLYVRNGINTYKARDSKRICDDLPELCVVSFSNGSDMYALASVCRSITGVKQL